MAIKKNYVCWFSYDLFSKIYFYTIFFERENECLVKQESYVENKHKSFCGGYDVMNIVAK